jgi:hypothetical protein
MGTYGARPKNEVSHHMYVGIVFQRLFKGIELTLSRAGEYVRGVSENETCGKIGRR